MGTLNFTRCYRIVACEVGFRLSHSDRWIWNFVKRVLRHRSRKMCVDCFSTPFMFAARFSERSRLKTGVRAAFVFNEMCRTLFSTSTLDRCDSVFSSVGCCCWFLSSFFLEYFTRHLQFIICLVLFCSLFSAADAHTLLMPLHGRKSYR